MTRTLEVSDEAQIDLLAIVDWLDERSEEAGDNFLSDSRACFTHLLRLPNAGRPFEATHKSRRPFRYCRVSVRFHDYLVFYQVHPRSIRIVAIVHGSRDLDALLHDRV